MAVRLTVPVHARYVLIWFTKLPPLAGGGSKFEAFVSGAVLRGSG